MKILIFLVLYCMFSMVALGNYANYLEHPDQKHLDTFIWVALWAASWIFGSISTIMILGLEKAKDNRYKTVRFLDLTVKDQ